MISHQIIVTYRAMIVESYAPGNETANFYSYGGKDGAHMPTNMNLMKLDADCNAKCAYDLINEWMEVANQHQMWSNWQVRMILRFYTY